jgi:hypothetical protein
MVPPPSTKQARAAALVQNKPNDSEYHILPVTSLSVIASLPHESSENSLSPTVGGHEKNREALVISALISPIPLGPWQE